MVPPAEEHVIPAMTKIDFLTHSHLKALFDRYSELKDFLPDQIRFERIPKRILFTVF